MEEKKPAPASASSAPPKAPKPKTSESGGRRYHEIEISSIRRAIAKRLTYSKTTIPHQYISITSNVDQILKLRKQMISDPKATVKVSVNDFIIKAVAYGLRVSVSPRRQTLHRVRERERDQCLNCRDAYRRSPFSHFRRVLRAHCDLDSLLFSASSTNEWHFRRKDRSETSINRRC